MKQMLIGLMIMTSALVYGGDKGGNGGKGVFCPGTNSYEVLDYHRADIEFGYKRSEDINGNTALEKAINLVKRIEKFNPKRAERYIHDLINFRSESRELTGNKVVATNDSDEVAYCADGEIVQIVNQRVPSSPREKRYTINMDLFNLLSPFHQAILMVHEVILKETIALGIDHANTAARFNALIFSEEIRGMNKESFAEATLYAGLLVIDAETKTEISEITKIMKKGYTDQFALSFVIPTMSSDLFEVKSTGALNLLGVQDFGIFVLDQNGSLAKEINKFQNSRNPSGRLTLMLRSAYVDSSWAIYKE